MLGSYAVIPANYEPNCRCAFLKGFSFRAPAEQYSIPDAANRRLIPDRLNVTLHFMSSNLVAVSDGTGKLFLLITGDRHEDSEWKVVQRLNVVSFFSKFLHSSLLYRVF